MIANHGRFEQPPTALGGDKQDFRVESITIVSLISKDRFCRRTSKRLEPALHVPVIEPGHVAHNNVADPADRPSQPGLGLSDQIAVDVSRAEHDVETSFDDRLNHLYYLGRRNGHISVVK